MIVEKKTKDTIIISFSRKIGAAGFHRIKSYIEFLEQTSAGTKRRKVIQSTIQQLADEVTEAAWQRLRKEKFTK